MSAPDSVAPPAAAVHHLLLAQALPPPGSPLDLLPTPPPDWLPPLCRALRITRVWDGGSHAPDAPPSDNDDDAPAATPHECALAHALGLPDAPGRTPWAAFESRTAHTPCAWLLPVHLQTGMDSVQLTDPAALPLDEAASRALMTDCAALLADDGLHLHHSQPGRWLAQGALCGHIDTAPTPAAAAGRRLSRQSLARARDAAAQRQLTRLLAELEMLLAAHPVNAAREAAGLPPLNAVWLYGAGALPALPPTPAAQGVLSLNTWAEAAAHGPALLAAQRQGRPVQLTLCSPRRAITLGPARQPWWARMGLAGRHRPSDVLGML